MPGVARYGDMGVGVCNHGKKECPHTVAIYIMQGAPTVLANGLPTARVGDVCVTTCPHCGSGICMGGSSMSISENMGNHRQSDAIILPGGSGTTVQASADVRDS